MPQITVRFFGPARDLAGREQCDMNANEGETVGTLAGRMAEQFPKLGGALGIRLAVNGAFVALNQPLNEGDEVAVIPPVSGGAPVPRVGLTRDALDAARIAADLSRPDAGAVVTFSGVVRAELDGCKPLAALEYEAYEEMALRQMEKLRTAAMERHEILDAAVWHRLGRLAVGEASIVVAVASAHRTAAYDACRWIVDQVKTDVPIWKKNVWSDGSADWVDPTAADATGYSEP